MKVLFVHDCAHTALDLSKALRKLGVNSELLPLRGLWGTSQAIRNSDADLIHANYINGPAYASYLGGKPYVLEAHGDDIRWKVSPLQKIAIGRAKLVFHSTKDLEGIIPDSVLLPQPVDMELFQPLENNSEKKKALYFLQSTSDPRLRVHESSYIERIKKYCITEGYELFTPRMMNIPYSQMPEYLSQYSLFFDKEWVFDKGVHSKTALQCMAMKIPVYNFPDVIKNYEFVLAQHDSNVVAAKLKSYYSSVVS